MRATCKGFVGWLTILLLLPGWMPQAISAQTSKWIAPRTADGQPDLQGFWQHQGMGTGKMDETASLGSWAYGREWDQQVHRRAQNLPMGVVDPQDGRAPLQPWASGQNNSYHFIQSPGYVALYTEYNHQLRVIPLDNRAHLRPGIRLYNGDSIGRWEHNTLIIETTNQAVPGTQGYGMLDMQGTLFSDALRVIERYTLVDANTIAYEATLNDPKVYSKPWKTAGAFTRAPADFQVFEHSCHEGNRAMEMMSFRIPRKPGK